jgi:excisionase family DNA binding protein
MRLPQETDMTIQLPDYKVDESFTFLTVKEAADIACVSPSTVRNWIKGSLRSFSYGRVIRIAKPDLLDFISRFTSENNMG